MDIRILAYWARRARIKDIEFELVTGTAGNIGQERFQKLCDEWEGLRSGKTPKEIYWERIHANRAWWKSVIGAKSKA